MADCFRVPFTFTKPDAVVPFGACCCLLACWQTPAKLLLQLSELPLSFSGSHLEQILEKVCLCVFTSCLVADHFSSLLVCLSSIDVSRHFCCFCYRFHHSFVFLFFATLNRQLEFGCSACFCRSRLRLIVLPAAAAQEASFFFFIFQCVTGRRTGNRESAGMGKRLRQLVNMLAG